MKIAPHILSFLVNALWKQFKVNCFGPQVLFCPIYDVYTMYTISVYPLALFLSECSTVNKGQGVSRVQIHERCSQAEYVQ